MHFRNSEILECCIISKSGDTFRAVCGWMYSPRNYCQRVNSQFVVLGISEREERGVVCAPCLGQRAASGPGIVHAMHQFCRSFSAVEFRQQQSARAGERSLRSRSVRTTAEPRRHGQPGCYERRPPKSYSVGPRAGASRHCPSDAVWCPLYRWNLRRRCRCRHLCYRQVVRSYTCILCSSYYLVTA